MGTLMKKDDEDDQNHLTHFRLQNFWKSWTSDLKIQNSFARFEGGGERTSSFLHSFFLHSIIL